MTDLTRPDFGEVWATEGEKLSPDSAKIKLGWVREMMPYQYQNYLQARTDESLTYLFQKGIPEYSPTQEYTAQKSIVQYQGAVYLAKATVTGVVPTTTASWKRVSTISDDSGVVSIAGGGTGATSAANARTNLGLGSAALLDAGVVVQKDSSGNFTAGTITASLVGNASSADKWKTARQLSITGAVTSNVATVDGSTNITLNTTSVDATKLTGVASVNTTGNAGTATKLASPITVTLTGGASGTSNASDGSSNFTVNVTGLNAASLSSGTIPESVLGAIVAKQTSSVGSLKLPSGSTADRDASPQEGYTRWNTQTKTKETWNGVAWTVDTAQSEAFLRNRANHTGTQSYTTIDGLGSAATRNVGTSAGNVMEVGTFGLGADGAGVRIPESGSNLNTYKTIGHYGQALTTGAGNGTNYPIAVAGGLDVLPTGANGSTSAAQFYRPFNANRIFYRTCNDGTFLPWVELRHTGNTTVDSNGFLKAASPIINLYDHKIEKNDSREIAQTSFERVSEGVYLLRDCPPLSDNGWYLEQPKDRNNNVYHNVEWYYDETERTLRVETFARVWNQQTGQYDNDVSVDIQAERFISLRFKEDPILYPEL